MQQMVVHWKFWIKFVSRFRIFLIFARIVTLLMKPNKVVNAIPSFIPHEQPSLLPTIQVI